ncbi:hypothetical protein, partial [Enterococcus faecalis]|uniref:hypothetical protein n=1 Tax=Enterococcus faecalis TaxID=1351 RepID=UPI003CC677DA
LLFLNLPFKNKPNQRKPKKVSTSLGFSLFKIEKQRKRFNRQIKKDSLDKNHWRKISYFSRGKEVDHNEQKNFNGAIKCRD